MACFIKQLTRNFSDNLIGLSLSPEGKPTLWSGAFSCCHEEALLSLRQNQGVAFCALQARLNAVTQLLELYERVWGKPFTHYHLRNHETVTAFINNLRSGQLRAAKGSAFTSHSPKQEASPIIWLLALVATWRFGLKAHVVTLGKTQASGLLPQSFAPGLLILVEQKESLRLPHVAFDFTTLVNWCEGAMRPLWIDVLYEKAAGVQNSPEASLAEKTPLDVKTAFKKRTARYLSAPPLSWLDADCQSRLQSVCFFHKHFS